MDITGLAAFLAPFLPALVKGAERLAADAADRLGDAAFGVAKRMWELLRPKVEADPRTRDTVEEVAEDPDDEVLQAMLAKRLEQLLADDPALAADLDRLLEQGRAITVVSASGERSVAVGRDVTGTIITGDDAVSASGDAVVAGDDAVVARDDAVVTGDETRSIGPTDSRGRPAVGGEPTPAEPPD